MSLNLAEMIIAVPLGVGLTVGGIYSVGSLFTTPDVKAVGQAFEEWSVTAPGKPTPSTGGYMEYMDFKSDKEDKFPYSLENNLPKIYKAGKTWVKVTPSETNSSFTVCMHRGDTSNPAGIDVLSYDSVTGEEAENEEEICQQ
jgi:hypothetical protein